MFKARLATVDLPLWSNTFHATYAHAAATCVSHPNTEPNAPLFFLPLSKVLFPQNVILTGACHQQQVTAETTKSKQQLFALLGRSFIVDRVVAEKRHGQ